MTAEREERCAVDLHLHEQGAQPRPSRSCRHKSVCLSVCLAPLLASAPLRRPPCSARFRVSRCSAAVVFPHSYEALRHAARRRVVYFPMAVILTCLIRHGSAGRPTMYDSSPLGLGKPKHGSSRTAGASRRTRPCPPHHANFWAEMGPPSCPSLRLGPERAADPFPFLFLMRLVDAAAGPWPCPPTPLITRTAEIGEGSATRRGSIAGFQP